METCLCCAKCCEQTEMLLSNEDVRRIRKQTGEPRWSFMFIRDGYIFLKNKRKHCIFLDSKRKKCSIYEIRPQGCRFYPLIYNPFSKGCIVDRDCTNRENIPKSVVKQLCPEIVAFIQLLDKEQVARLKITNRRKDQK
ncbi:MAG: YkgJ family cysteine cluster protein [Candidatus Helarchaeota archaeon]